MGTGDELIDETDTRAEVRVGGQLRAVLDAGLLRELAEHSLTVLGAEVEPAQIDQLVGQLSAQLAAGSPLADDVIVIREGGPWLVCDDIEVGSGAGAAAEQSEAGMCAYMTVDDGLLDAKLGRYDFPFADTRAALPAAADELVAGRRAILSGNDLFVQLEDGSLYVSAPAQGLPDGGIDYLVIPASVAELVLSRIEG